MKNQAWLDELRERLEKHALPPAYIRRFMEELSDHLQDIMEENMNTEANSTSRLGKPEQISESAIVAYRQRNFLSRHPTAAFFVFSISPILSLIALDALVLGIFVLAIWLIGEEAASGITKKIGLVGQAIAPYLLALFFLVIPSIVLSILYCRLAKRLCLRKSWMFASCISLAAMAMCVFWSASFSDIPGKNNLSCGFGIPAWKGWIPPIQNLVQFIIPLATGCWFIRRTHEQCDLKIAR
jgi:hypothetical protein